MSFNRVLEGHGDLWKVFKKERNMPRSVFYIEGQPSEGMKKEKKLGRKDKLAAHSRKKLMVRQVSKKLGKFPGKWRGETETHS